jgi:hypothetical protein
MTGLLEAPRIRRPERPFHSTTDYEEPKNGDAPPISSDGGYAYRNHCGNWGSVPIFLMPQAYFCFFSVSGFLFYSRGKTY